MKTVLEWENYMLTVTGTLDSAQAASPSNLNGTYANEVITVGSLSPGGGYTDSTYMGVTLSGGSGKGAVATVVVLATSVTSVVITSAGTGYIAGDILSVTPNQLGGTGTGFSITVVTATGPGVGATLTSLTPTALVVDGYAANVNDRILLLNQTNPIQNGVYIVTNAGSGLANWVLTRSSDFNNSIAGQVKVGVFIFVVNGTVNAASSWLLSVAGTGIGGVIIIGTDAITFTESNSILYTFLPGANVFVVQASTFGIGKGLVTSVAMAQSTPSVVTITYAITYNNPARTPAPVDSSMVFATLAAAWAYYQTVIS